MKKNVEIEREREIPKEDEKVFLGLWRNWSEAEQTFSLTDKDTVAEAKQSLKAKPKPQRICVTVHDFGITFCHRMLIMIWSFILQSSCYFALDFFLLIVNYISLLIYKKIKIKFF